MNIAPSRFFIMLIMYIINTIIAELEDVIKPGVVV